MHVKNSKTGTAFGSLMPQRFQSAEKYRYGFNTQEKVDEISGNGNHYTAPYWEYDPRTGRRWNLDPKPHPGWSPYAIMQNNPIWYTDPLGDTLRTNGSAQANQDIKSVAGKYSGAVDISADNQVSINFDLMKGDAKFYNKKGEFKEKKFENFKAKGLSSAGIGLLSDLAGDKLNYLYTTDLKYDVEYKVGQNGAWTVGTIDNTLKAGQTVTDFSWFDNLSTTPRGDESQYQNYFFRPANGNDGHVNIAPGTYFSNNGNGSGIAVKRASVVFHELKENYYRTHHKLPYQKSHSKAIFDEGPRYGNPTPGGFYQFKYK